MSTGSIASIVNDMFDCGLQYSDVIAISLGVLEFWGGIWLIGLVFLGIVWIRRLSRHTKKVGNCDAGVRARVENCTKGDGGIDGRPPTRTKKIRHEKKVRKRRASFRRRCYRRRDQDAGGMNLENLGKSYYLYGLYSSFISLK